MSKQAKRPLAVFLLSKVRKIGDFILKVISITQDIDANPGIFVTPVPATSQVTSDIGDLAKAEGKVLTKAPGSAAARDVAYSKVMDDVNGLLAYVQILADKAADEQASIAIIQASGFSVKVNGVRVKAPLTAKNGKVSGTIDLAAKAADKRASYNWQQSNDNGTSWLNLPTTLQAKTSVAGLTPATRVLFRVQAVTRTGTEGWSQSVSVVVM